MNQHENIDSNVLFDNVLKEVGGFGRYQKSLLAISLLVSILSACNHLAPIYLTYSPDYQCVEGDAQRIINNVTNVRSINLHMII